MIEHKSITIVKRNPAGGEAFRYQGEVKEQSDRHVVIEAKFNHPDLWLHGMELREGDRFVEIYYADRWYNIFEIHDRRDDRLKGWYCNVSTPAVIEADTLTYLDLALDLLVFPDGRQTVLDEDEFAGLDLPAEMRDKALTALEELRRTFRRDQPPRFW